MRKKILIFFFTLGFFSLLTQTVIIREFLIAFGGGQLGIGLFYSFWLWWVGVGAFCARLLPRASDKHFLVIAASYPFFAFCEIFLFINLRQYASVSPWELFIPQKVFLFLLLFTVPVSFLTGILFTAAIRWYARFASAETLPIVGRAYAFEAAGSFVAGCLVTAVFYWHAPVVTVTAIAGFLFTLVIFAAAWRSQQKGAALLSFFLITFLIASFFHMPRLEDLIARMRSDNIFPSGRLRAEVITPYQHLLLSQLADTAVIVSNGEIITTIPNRADADYQSALFMAQAPEAREVLVIGYGAENLIRSLLAFPVTRVTYCFEDRAYYEAMKQYIPPDVRLTVVCDSPRTFLKKTNSFDLIIVNTPEPSDLFTNGFYTREFYELLRKNLSGRGIIATAFTSAENFMGTQIRDYGSSLYYTLRAVFSNVVITPQERAWFLAGGPEATISEDPAILASRLKQIVPASSVFKPEGFASIFLPARLAFFKDMYIENSLFKATGLYNTDRQPLTFFLNTLVLARRSGLPLAPLITRAFFSGFIIFCVPLCIFFIARLVFLARIENRPARRLFLHATIFQFVSGFLGFSFHLCLIFMFQNRFGTIFVFIGALSALFMLGLAAGGFAGRIFAFRFSPALTAAAVLTLQGVLVLFGCVFFVLAHMPTVVAGGLFIIFFFIGGFFTGNSYPLVAAIFKHTGTDTTLRPATLVVLDHWGGALAGAITGVLLLPLVGLIHTLLILALVAFFAAGLCALESKYAGAFLKRRSISFLSFPYVRFSCVLIATALSLLFLRYFLERPVSAPGLPVTISAAEPGCIIQEKPFRALVCPTAAGREYRLDSNNFGAGVKGFAGPLRIRLRVSEHGEIREVSIIEHRETALYVRELENFLAQFSGRRVTESFSRDTVDVMSGATITSDAVLDFVKEAARLVRDPLDQGLQFQKKSPVVFDGSFWYAFLMLCGALILYGFPARAWLRTAFLFIVVIFSGFVFNHTFSLTHLAHIFTLRPIPLAVASVVFMFFAPLTLGIFFGQLWCGWLCPFGALQELVGFRARTLSARIDKKARYGKYLILFGVVLAVVFSSSEFWFAHEPLSVFFSRVPVRFKLLGLLALFFSLFFKRFWCRYFCAAGAFLSFFNKIGFLARFPPKRYMHCPFHVSGPLDIDCIQCNICRSVSCLDKRGELHEK